MRFFKNHLFQKLQVMEKSFCWCRSKARNLFGIAGGINFSFINYGRQWGFFVNYVEE